MDQDDREREKKKKQIWCRSVNGLTADGEITSLTTH